VSLTSTVIDFIIETDYSDLPQEAVEATKKLFIDTAGVALAGSSAAGVEATLHLLRKWGGSPESTVWVFGDKLPSLHAALINCMMAHALDYDECHGEVPIHSLAPVLPTALAMAECDETVTGRELITAIVVGAEVASKLGLSIIERDKGWHLSATCGVFACAAVAGKLLKLDRQQMRNALGIGYTQAAGTQQSTVDGALTKRMQPGFSARSGIFSALLAQDGITGPEHFFEGPFGFFNLYQDGRYDAQVLLNKMGAPFEIVNIATKPYPCCRLAHSPLDVLFALLKESDLRLDEVETIDVHGSQAMKKLCGKPFRVGQENEIDAAFSLPFIMASAIERKVIDMDSFSREAAQSSALAPHTGKVSVIGSDDVPSRWSTRVVIRKKNGQVLSGSLDSPKGQPDNPMSWEECVEKFNRCAMAAAKPFNQDRLMQFVRGVEDLENTNSAKNLVPLLRSIHTEEQAV
jgi:2-methylcitrate dehydratase PrpD